MSNIPNPEVFGKIIQICIEAGSSTTASIIWALTDTEAVLYRFSNSGKDDPWKVKANPGLIVSASDK
jgi:hypothetical protein